MLLGAAACLAGLDPARMNRLPEVADGRNEFIVVRSQRNMYDRALLVAGGRIVEVGIPDRYSGPGVRDAAAWEIAAAITPHTAGIYYLAHQQSLPPLADVAAVAREHGIPLLVDAAAQLPPADNLRRFLAQGADLVAFSGGKAIGGPQASGILCGRGDLIGSALLQMLDLDLFPDLWRAPAEFAPLAQLPGLPHHGIGRSCKVGKEEIIGLLVALERFAADDEAARRAEWRSVLEAIVTAAGDAGAESHSGRAGSGARDRRHRRRCACGAPRGERPADRVRPRAPARRRAAVLAGVAHHRAGRNHRQAAAPVLNHAAFSEQRRFPARRTAALCSGFAATQPARSRSSCRPNAARTL